MRILIIMLGVMFSFVSNASNNASSEWSKQFNDWTCYGKSGVIEEAYKIESYTDNVSADGDRAYNLLCTFARKIELNNEVYLLRILFPNCQFNSDNQLITTKLSKYIENNAEVAIEDSKYQISFPPSVTYFTGTEINQDQNVKAAFFIELLGHTNINLNIQDIGDAGIDLGGLQQGIQTTYCNQ